MVKILICALFFTAPWCEACKKAKPIILELKNEGYEITIKEDEFKEYGITKLPTLLIDGKKYPGLRTKKQYKEILDDNRNYF